MVFLISGPIDFSGSAYTLHAATDSASTPLTLVSSVSNFVSSSPILSDQHKTNRVVVRPVLGLITMLFASTHVIFAMSSPYMATRVLEKLEIR